MNDMRTLPKSGLAFSVALIILCTMSISVSLAQNPFTIDGDVPDTNQIFDDPAGSTKELAAENGSHTKIGVINSAAAPMLGNTNPNPQVDLTEVRIASAVAADGDIWLYFFWERDSNNGSGFIALELGKNPAPEECDFSGALTEAELIEGCNPWANRADGDSLFLWDQQGGSLEIIQRIYDETIPGFDPTPIMLNDPTVVEAAIGSDTSNGELAINLSELVFEPGVCANIANILPSTVTGNSDTADYKDTTFFPSPVISTCGTVIIRKVTIPAGTSGDFEFDHNLVTQDSQDNPFFLAHGESETILNVFANDPNNANDVYFVTETLVDGFELADIDCSASNTVATPTEDEDNLTATFKVEVNKTVDCTFKNRALASLTVVKDVVNACAVDNTTFPISISDANGVIESASLGDGGELAAENIATGTYTIAETGNNAYVTLLSCNGSTPVAQTSRSVTLNPGDDVTCTFRNVKKPSVTVKKALNGVGTFDLKVGTTTVANDVGDGGMGTLTNVNTGFTASNNTFGGVTVSETASDGTTSVTGFNTFISCDDSNATTAQATSVDIPVLLSGETVTCTIYNNQITAAACPAP